MPLDNLFLRTISCIDPELVMSKSKTHEKSQFADVYFKYP